MRMASSRWGVQDIALFLVLAILANGLLFGAVGSADLLLKTFYLALFVHLGFSLYLGWFDRRRTATWLALIAGWAVAEIGGFAAFIIPLGQAAFWAATIPLIGPLLAALISAAPIALPVVVLVLLGVDLWAMHAARWRGRSAAQIALFLAAVLVAAVVLGLVLAAFVPPRPTGPQSFAILPSWPLLPFFALLRAAPIKLAGIALAFAALLAPAIWPWAGAEKLRASRAAWLWIGLSAAFAAAWLALGYLGAQPVSEGVLTATRGLAAVYFAFFITPFVLRRWLSRKGQSGLGEAAR
jgi:ubiquinol-cytochrome c reductase cytochrome b subunit